MARLGGVAGRGPQPLRSLFAFKRITLRRGEATTVSLTLNLREVRGSARAGPHDRSERTEGSRRGPTEDHGGCGGAALVTQLSTVDVRGRRYIAAGQYRVAFSLDKASLAFTLTGDDSYLDA